MTQQQKQKNRKFCLVAEEISYSPSALRVDREAGIIYGCKVIGLQSYNKRRYLSESLRNAVPLYEGVIVNLNHPVKPQQPRQVEDFFGKLQNIRCETDGLYGDLHYLKTHPQAAQICEAAERFPDKFGLSHNATADGWDDADGNFIIQKITEVKSVDVVSSPATTNGLFEHRGIKKMTVKELFKKTLNKLSTTKTSRLAKFISVMESEKDKYMDANCEEAEGEELDPEKALWEGFKAAIDAIMSDDELDAKGKAKKIGSYLRAHEKLGEPEKEEEEETEEQEDEEETEGDDKKTPKAKDGKKDEDEEKGKKEEEKTEKKEKLAEQRRELKTLRKKERIRDLLEQANIPSDPDLVKILMATADDALASAISREKKLRVSRNQPRSGNVQEQQQKTGGLGTIEGFMGALRRN